MVSRKKARSRTGRQGKGRRPVTAREGKIIPQMPGDPSSGLVRTAFLERLEEDSRAGMLEGLAQSPTVEFLCNRVAEEYNRFDAMQEQFDFSPPLACERGCSYCCFNQIPLSPPEALYLGFYILETCPPGRLEAIRRDVDAVLELIRGKDVWERGKIRHLIPCPLLVDGYCSVHPARPLACRGWNAVDREQCRQSVELRDPMMGIENYEIQRKMAEAIQTGMLRASRDAGLEAGYLVISRALSLMLEKGVAGCAGDWLGGRPFFASRQAW